MMPQTQSLDGHPTLARLRTVAIVSRRPDRHVIEAVVGAVDHDVVLVEPTAHAYSQIRRIRPDLVVVCVSGDDLDACQVLSMLTLDRETAAIPVLTHMSDSTDASVCEPTSGEGLLDHLAPVILN